LPRRAQSNIRGNGGQARASGIRVQALNYRAVWLFLLAVVAFPPHLRGEIRLLGVTTSAGFAPGLPAPGSLGTIFCTGLIGINGIVAAETNPLPKMLAGVRVTVGSTDAPILAVAELGGYQIVNFQMPWEANGPVALVQGNGGAVIQATPAPWGQFFTDAAGFAIALHAVDFSLVTADRPSRPGEWIVIYGSNFGTVANPPPSGALTPSDRLFPLEPGSPVGWDFRVFMINNIALESNFIGLAPGMVGVYQINVKMPEVRPSGLKLYVQRSRLCGFFFVHGCGRGIVLDTSVTASLH